MVQCDSVSLKSKQVLRGSVHQLMTETTCQKCGQSQILRMSHQFEMYNDKQVKMEDIKSVTGVPRPA